MRQSLQGTVKGNKALLGCHSLIEEDAQEGSGILVFLGSRVYLPAGLRGNLRSLRYGGMFQT